MHTHRAHAHDIARDTIVSFRDIAPDERAAKLASLTMAAEKSATANSIRGKALIQFWGKASHAVALDSEHVNGTYSGTAEAHGNQREVAIVAAGDALFAFTVSVVPVSVAALLSGEPAPV
ncbi:hypothetical protein GOD78_10980 [Sinorhizobium medicae]|nr:hypothetical protein [Sinorhizobium medicae]MDX0818041.1 hypothetical protein [Sinorhizobium medicae]